jgi:hypothetical protein
MLLLGQWFENAGGWETFRLEMFEFPTMTVDERLHYVDRLAARGLQIFLFDGRTLVLRYSENDDTRPEQDGLEDRSALVSYAFDLLEQLPKAARMFPGLTQIEIECARTQAPPSRRSERARRQSRFRR